MSTITRRGLNRRSLLTATGAAAIGLTFTACGEKPKATPGGEEPKLNFYNWDTY
ncbi:MAG: spermidine/putrescine ABC transporter substrate-binding protein, partial [Caulobacter sp.]|nr:spermidine/putrescine ABC transporter substrate-binding protein [Caulobacter sp.]